MNGQHRDRAGSRDRKLKFLTRCKQPMGRKVRKERTERAVVFSSISKYGTLQGFSLYVLICVSRHKLLFIALYIVIEGSLNMLGAMKNDIAEFQCGCQKLNNTLDSCLLFVNRGRSFKCGCSERLLTRLLDCVFNDPSRICINKLDSQ